MEIIKFLDFTQSIVIILISYLLFFILFYVIRYLKRNNEDRVKKYTFEFCTNDKTNYTSLISRIQSKSTRGNEIDSELFGVLSHFEKIAIGVKNKIFNKEIISDYYARYFVLFYQVSKYEVLLEYRNSNNAPFVFIEFEKLANKWANDSERRIYYDR